MRVTPGSLRGFYFSRRATLNKPTKYKKVDYGYWWYASKHAPIFSDPDEAWKWIDDNAAGGCWNVTRACPYHEIALEYDKFRDEYYCPKCEPRG
jgi:hypothetical protein